MGFVARGVVLTLVATGVPAWAQGKLDAHTMKAFGGTYQVECGNNAAPKATVFADALVFLHGDKRIAGSNVQSAASFYGPGQCVNAAKTFKGYALHELSAAGLLYDPKAKATYFKALGPLSKEPWLAKLDGPSPQNRPVKVAGGDYVRLSACKNHDCAENNTVLLYSAAPEVVYGKVYERGKSTLIGTPPSAVASDLEALWK